MTANKFGLFLIPSPPPPPPFPVSQSYSLSLIHLSYKKTNPPSPLCVTPSMNDP